MLADAYHMFKNHTPPPCTLQDVPEDCTVGFTVDFVWKSTSFDRMRDALNQLDKDRTSISGFLYHTLLGEHREREGGLGREEEREGEGRVEGGVCGACVGF